MATNETTTSSHLMDSIDESDAEIKRKQNPFRKVRSKLQENFNVSFQESNLECTGLNTVLESPATFTQQRPDLFANGNISSSREPVKSFHHDPSSLTPMETSHETTRTPHSGSSSTLSTRPNLFTQHKLEQTPNFSIDFEPTKTNFPELTGTTLNSVLFKTTSASSKSQTFQTPFNQTPTPDLNNQKSSQEDTVTAYKTHLFKTPPEESTRDPFQMSFEDSLVASTFENHSPANLLFIQPSQNERTFNVSYDTTTTISQKNVPQQVRHHITASKLTPQSCTQNNIPKDDHIKDPETKETEEIIRQEVTTGMPVINSDTNQNLTHNGSQHHSKSSSLDYSSFNDHNLKYWMSDSSDEEILPCNVSKVQSTTKKATTTSSAKETPKNPTVPLSWREKFNKLMTETGEQMNVAEKKETKRGGRTAKKEPRGDEKAKRPHEGMSDKLKKQMLSKGISLMMCPYLIEKLKPKFGIQSNMKTETLALTILEAVKKVLRKKDYQKNVVDDLKRELALAGVVETTVDFYQFVREFLPFEFRVKVVPAVQLVTNIIYPPKDTANPLEKIIKE